MDIPNVIRLKSLEPFELFIIEIAGIEVEGRDIFFRPYMFDSYILCCHFKKAVTMFLSQFKKEEQDLNMNNLNNNEILNSIQTQKVYPICKSNRRTRMQRHRRMYDWRFLHRFLRIICHTNRDKFPYADILIRNLDQYFVQQNENGEPNNRIGMFYFHNGPLTEVILISGKKICVRQYKFDQAKKVYVSMQRSNVVNVISILPSSHNYSLRDFSLQFIMKRITTKSVLTKEDLEKLELPTIILKEMERKGLQIFRHLQ
ncbi:uncharacterized protein LOC116846408 [Odontomachus brunneus]|uniref:uncharacterized protein LOC116846408 n=1 Tax=Odontomachus brunneus TaxID=486640 RepID=UPI0013F26832|nr:uncharacterized protein LOC116846408 [Odontomachus brunneus]